MNNESFSVSININLTVSAKAGIGIRTITSILLKSVSNFLDVLATLGEDVKTTDVSTSIAEIYNPRCDEDDD
jgi:hypothetical protein